jgi:hypothetical protein
LTDVLIVRRLALAAACLVAAPCAAAADDIQAVSVETVAGESLKKIGLVSGAAGQFKFSDGSALPIDDLRSIRFPGSDAAAGRPPLPVVHLVGGGSLPVADAVLVDDACEVTLSGGQKVTLTLDDVAALQWAEDSGVIWNEALSKLSADHDLVVAKAMPQATSIRGFIEKIGPDAIEFDWDKQTRTLQRSQLIGVVFARPEATGEAKIRVHAGGAIIPIQGLDRSEDGRTFRCTLPRGSVIEVPLTGIALVDVRSSRLSYLSNLKPTAAVDKPIVALPRSWQADRNVRGEPLRAGTQVFEKGIGVQSGTSLTFDLGGRAEQFVATLSLDPPGKIKGDCEFVILGDGRELLRRHLQSANEPAPVRVPVVGVTSLEIRVDYGSNLDFGDHANWCEAHLVLATTAGNDSVEER